MFVDFTNWVEAYIEGQTSQYYQSNTWSDVVTGSENVLTQQRLFTWCLTRLKCKFGTDVDKGKAEI